MTDQKHSHTLSLRRSVRNRLVATFLLVILAVVSLATVANMYIHLRRMEADLKAQTTAALMEAQNILLRRSRQAMTTARHLAGLYEVRADITSPALAGLMEDARALWSMGLVEIFDTRGRRLAASQPGDAQALRFATAPDSPALKNALDLSESTDFYANAEGLCVKSFAPVLAPGTMQVQGAVVVTYHVSGAQLAAFKEQVRADFALRWDDSGRVTSTLPDSTQVGAQAGAQDGANATGLALPAPGEFSRSTSLGLRSGPGGSYAMSAASLLDNQRRPVATLMALMSDTIIRQGIRDTTRLVLLSVALALLLALVLGFMVANSFTRPIHALREGIQALAEGRLNTRVHVARQDELGALAVGFNEMAEHMEAARGGIISALEIKESYARELEASYEKLTRFNQELEGVVARRTGEPAQPLPDARDRGAPPGRAPA